MYSVCWRQHRQYILYFTPALEGAQMTVSVTIKDIAQRAAVSIGTVSRVLNNHQNVAEEMRQRVLAAAAELGYNGVAGRRGVAPSTTAALREIGFLFCPVNEGTIAAANPYWSQILAGVEQEASQADMRLSYRTLGDLRHSPQRLQTLVSDLGFDGILLVGPVAQEVIAALRELRLPLVLVANYWPQSGVDAVLEDSFESMRQGIAYLIAQGHRDIAFIGGPSTGEGRPVNAMYPVEQRLDAYRTALMSADIPIDYTRYVGSNLTPEGGYQACQQLLACGSSFTALVCANDSTAIGAARALREAGLAIPAQVSLLGFGDYLHGAEQISPGLTTIRHDNVLMGRIAVQRLRARALDMDSPTLTILLNGALTVRGSVGVAPQHA
jgi:LacI family transcriptional regulator